MKKIYALMVALTVAVAAWGDSWRNYEYNSSEGKEFYLTFMNNLGSEGAVDLSMKLFMAARRQTQVTIKMNNTNQTYTLTVNGSTVWSVPNKSDAYVIAPHQVSNRSITVTASDTITLYMAGFFDAVGDASLVLPKNRLDKEYIIQSSDVNNHHTEFAVVATENNTQVTITPSVQLTGQTSATVVPANVSYTRTLQKGQVYFGSSMTLSDDVSGTKICATKSVAVFSGSVSATVGNSFGTASHVSHQMQPWKMCGTRFPIVRYVNDMYNSNVVRVTALYNNTVVKRNGVVVGTLQAKGTMNVAWPGGAESMMVETSKQAVVCQYMAAKGGAGSPAMAFATDVQQGVSSIKFTTFPIEFNRSGVIVQDTVMQSYVNVVVETAAVGTMMLDNTAIGSQFTALNGDATYSYAQVRISQGEHELTNSGGQFHATVYGYDTLGTPSYVFNAGLNCQAQSAYFLLNGVRQNEIEICQSADWKWHFTTTSIIPGDYTSVQWYDLYNGRYTYMSSDSIWNAALSGRGEQEHTIEMRVQRSTPVCGSTVTDKVTAKVICHARYEDTLAIREQCRTDVITLWEETGSPDTVRCDTLTVDSVYNYTREFFTIYGCDSIVTKRVMVIDRQNMRVERTICQGDTAMLNDSVYSQTGVYIVPGLLGTCPFTDTLYLTVNPTYRFTERDTVCRSELPYVWRGKSINDAAGVRMYYDSLKTGLGCDSLYEIELTIGATYDITDTVALCDVDTPYEWHGGKYSATGVYYDSLATQAFGCDSVHRLMLTVHPTYLMTDSATVCSNEAMVWRDSTYRFDNMFGGETHGRASLQVVVYDSLRTVAGCDSVYKRVVTVNRAYEFDTVAVICDYDSVVWRAHHISGMDSGYYEIADSLKTGLGCDSVYRLRLTVNKSYHQTMVREICQGESYQFDKRDLTWKSNEPGVYDSTVTYHTAAGCDSVLELQLTVHPVYSIERRDTVCNNQTYHWSEGAIDTLINERGGGEHQYVKRFRTAAGCDSIYTLYLMVLDTVAVDTAAFMPDKGSVYWDGRWYCGGNATGQCDTVLAVRAAPYVFTHKYTAANGCDSVRRLTLKIDSTYDRTLNVKTCQGEDYSFNGRKWSWMKDSVGDHDTTYYYVTKSGWDSIWHLHLHVDRVYEFHQTDSTCRNVPYTWSGHRRTYSGLTPGLHVMYDSLFTTKSCDSVYVLELTVIDTVAVTNHITMDDNKSITWGGMTIGGSKYRGTADTVLSSGFYYFVKRFTSTECGCDSVMHLYLTVRNTFEGSVGVTTCQNDDYQVNGRTWSWRKGVVGDHDTTCMYRDRWGVDSIWRVRVRVNPVYYFPETWTMCENDTFVWRGHGRSFQGLESGTYVYYDSLKTTAACDSVYKLTLTVNDTADATHYITICDNETVTWDGEKFVGDRSGDSTGTVCAARVNPYIIEHLYHKAGTGCDSVERLVLTVKKGYEFVTDTTVCSKNGFLFHNTVYYVSGTYYDSLKTHEGCDSVYVLNLTLDNTSLRRQYIGICEGDSFLYRGRVIKNRCTFVDSLVSRIGGCDSVIEITVEVLPTYHFRDTVDICEGGVCNWRGKDLVYEGTYYDSLRTGTGCDSIYERYLRVHRKYLFVEYDTVCTDQPYHWRNRWYTESGTYHDSLRSHGGCDSVYELRLTIYEPNITEQYAEICQGQRFIFRGRDLSQTGVYYDTILTQHGCDSIMKLTLNVTRTYYFRDTAEICDGESYAWRGRSLAQAGTYRDTLGTVKSGCDSIYELFLIVHPKSHFIDYDTVCSQGVYNWRGKALTLSGTYYDSLKSHWGCDSVYELRLTMYPVSVTEQYVEVCEGQSFDFRGRNITQPGVYYDTLTSIHGCDSIMKLTLNVTRTYYFRDTTEICDGESYAWRGRSLAQAGTYRDTLGTVKSGCDSIYELFLIVHPKSHFIDYDTVCSQGVYNWRGKAFTQSGTYYDSLKSHWGCDSVYELRLTMNAPYLVERRVDICQGQSFSFRGELVSAAGTYYDTLISSHGCDSIVKLTLNVMPTYYYRDTTRICDGDTFVWRGRRLANAGTYRDTLKTVSGCDSIYEICLIVNRKYRYIEYDTVCLQGVYNWRGMDITKSGTYYDKMKSRWGCDSVYELRLTMNEPYIVERRISICEGQSFSFRGELVSAAGTYYDTLISSHGCDSIVKLILNVMPTYYYRDTTQICDGETLTWRGRALTHAGTYRDTLRSAEGCDSIYEIYLTVNQKYHYIEYDTVCSQSVYNWRGKNLTQSGTYFDSLKSHLGCDSIYELRLTMNEPYVVERRVNICQGQSFIFRGVRLTADGTYYDTLRTLHGCDSIVKLILNVMPTYHHIDTVQVCDGSVYTWHGKHLSAAGTYYDSLRSAEGCDSIYELYLMVKPAYHYIEYDTVCTAEPYLWRGKYLSSGGIYFDSLRTTLGCDSLYELRLVLGAPTVTERYNEICEGDWFNFRGKRLNGAGIYYDTLISRFGCDSVFKLVLNVTPTYRFGDTVQICAGDVYTWRGRSLTVAGTYRDSFATTSGCDSIYELFLIVNPRFLDVDYDTVCTNDAYHWRGKWLTQSGTYYDSLKSKAGCDSVYMIYLTLNRPHIEVEYREICQGTQTTFRNRILTQDGVYDDTLKTTEGCDSIFRLVLNVRRTVIVYDTVHTCAGTQYNFRGRLLNRSGIYYDTVMYGVCRDSIFRLDLIVDSTYHYVASDTVCGGVYRWRGKTLTRSGVYYDSLKTQLSCDSVYELRLTVDSVRIRYEYDTICHGGTWWLNGRAITQAGVYCDTFPRGPKQCDSVVRRQLTVLPERVVLENTRHICQGDTFIFHGDVCTHEGMQVHVSAGVYPQCDTIYKMYLDVDTPFHQIDSATICSNESATFRGRVVTAAGVYYDTLTDQWGCDSIYEFRLKVKQATYVTFNVNICHNQYFTSPTGKRWNTQGVHYDTLVNKQGCDSILTYNLNVYAMVQYLDTLAICRGGSGVAFNGLTYSVPGTYNDTVNRTPANGCDTVFTTYVYYDTVFEPINKNLCAGDVFTLWGKSYNTAGTYTQFVTSRIPGDCDTLFTITITVNQPTDTMLYASTCDDQPYWFRGNLLTQSGTYKDTIQGINGCDSIIILRLTVQDSLTHPTEYRTICEDTVYRWIDGVNYSKDGTYHYYPQDSVTGCTEYYTLVLNTIKKTTLVSVKDTSMCQDDEVYYILPTFTGPAPTEYSVSYSGGAVGTSGYLDTSFIVLPVPKMPDGKRVKPDKYTVTLQVGNEGCGLSTLSKNFTLVVRYPSAVLEQHFNDVVSVLNYKYNDIYDDTHSNGYTFDAYRWYLNGRLVPGESKSNLYRTSMKQGDRVYAELRRSGETEFIPTCEIVIENFGIDTGYPVVIYRTSLPQASRTTKIKASEAATYRVCSVSGVILQSGDIDKDEEIELELPYVAGCYFLVVDAETAGRRIFKIVVN